MQVAMWVAYLSCQKNVMHCQQGLKFTASIVKIHRKDPRDCLATFYDNFSSSK